MWAIFGAWVRTPSRHCRVCLLRWAPSPGTLCFVWQLSRRLHTYSVYLQQGPSLACTYRRTADGKHRCCRKAFKQSGPWQGCDIYSALLSQLTDAKDGVADLKFLVSSRMKPRWLVFALTLPTQDVIFMQYTVPTILMSRQCDQQGKVSPAKPCSLLACIMLKKSEAVWHPMQWQYVFQGICVI